MTPTPSVEEILSLPETQRLAEVARLANELQGNAAECARIVVQMKAPSTREVAARWAPVIKDSVEGLARAQKTLRHVRAGMSTKRDKELVQWIETSPGRGLLRALIEVSSALADLVVRLHGLETEIRSIEMLGTIRSSMLNNLPSATRDAIVADAKAQRLLERDDG